MAAGIGIGKDVPRAGPWWQAAKYGPRHVRRRADGVLTTPCGKRLTIGQLVGRPRNDQFVASKVLPVRLAGGKQSCFGIES